MAKKLAVSNPPPLGGPSYSFGKCLSKPGSIDQASSGSVAVYREFYAFHPPIFPPIFLQCVSLGRWGRYLSPNSSELSWTLPPPLRLRVRLLAEPSGWRSTLEGPQPLIRSILMVLVVDWWIARPEAVRSHFKSEFYAPLFRSLSEAVIREIWLCGAADSLA